MNSKHPFYSIIIPMTAIGSSGPAVGGGQNPAVRGGRSSNDGTSDEECLFDKIQKLFNEIDKKRAQQQKDLLTVIKTTRTSFKNNN